MSDVVLVIGNKNYSSWSLRAWLALRKAGVEFEELRLPLDTPEFAREIVALSPSGRVPVLRHQGLCVWDSLAIAEYVNDAWAEGALWPQHLQARARARAVSAEMHSGFASLRQRIPMNCRATGRSVTMDAALQRDIDRVLDIWRECREQAADKGPWLFGSFSIADAMYAPVALRFITYGIDLPDTAADYVATVVQDADVSLWLDDARNEVEVVEADEAGI